MSGVLDQTGILNVAFEAETYLVNPVSSYSWDFNGDGTPEITGTELTALAQYQFPGIYFPRVTVTDNQGNVYTETALVNVFSREEMDSLLSAKWGGMRTAMTNKDVEKAGSYFADWTKERYTGIFSALEDRLPQIAQEMQNIGMIYLIDRVAKYRIRRTEGAGEITYYIYFVRDENGLWKIQQF